jgi:eukaryotic-like serine/threonine-protein kinase
MPLSTALTPVKRNILVDGCGRVRIADFGLAAITQNLDSVGNTTAARGHTPRWTAPEILNGGKHSQKGDIFSFAMVMVEVRHG